MFESLRGRYCRWRSCCQSAGTGTPFRRIQRAAVEFQFNVLNLNLVGSLAHCAYHLIVRSSFERRKVSNFQRRSDEYGH